MAGKEEDNVGSRKGVKHPAASVAIDRRRLKELREDKGLNRQQLADASGLSYSAIAKYETWGPEHRNPRPEAFKALCDALRCDPAELRKEAG
jgi:transcriptional regulator with XRE-family HTH domain